MNVLDAAIIGSGPAALSAALYLARAGVKVSMFEKLSIGGDLGKISKISNYPGFEGQASELIKIMKRQATTAGAQVELGECRGVCRKEDGTENSHAVFELDIDGEKVLAKSVLVATGSEPRTLDFEIKSPVSYCALCDAELSRGQEIAVVGGGNSAVQETIYLADFAKKITLITHSQLKASATLRRQLSKIDNVEIRENIEPTPELLNGFERVFVFIGKQPATSFLKSLGSELQKKGMTLFSTDGFILTGEAASGYGDGEKAHEESPTLHSSIIPGLYAAGDVRFGSPHQVITAAGDGAAAAIEIVNFVKNA